MTNQCRHVRLPSSSDKSGVCNSHGSLWLYFMLSSLLFSFGTGHCFIPSLFFFRWLHLVVYLPPPKPLFHNVIVSQEEAIRGKSVKGIRSVIGKIIVQMSWHLVLKRHKEGQRTRKAYLTDSEDKFISAWGLEARFEILLFCQFAEMCQRQMQFYFHSHAKNVVSEKGVTFFKK